MWEQCPYLCGDSRPRLPKAKRGFPREPSWPSWFPLLKSPNARANFGASNQAGTQQNFSPPLSQNLFPQLLRLPQEFPILYELPVQFQIRHD
jgi:hypothetical protein